LSDFLLIIAKLAICMFHFAIFCDTIYSVANVCIVTALSRKEESDMFTEQALEQHYASIPSEALHIIMNEYKWALDECGVHNDEQLHYIEKALTLRSQAPYNGITRKILFLCKCGQSRIVSTNTEDTKIKAFIFDQYNVPCSRCQNSNRYTWKYLT
jgi:hypothetical protein